MISASLCLKKRGPLDPFGASSYNAGMTTGAAIPPTIALNDGHAMPRVGLGVWKAGKGEETVNAVEWALAAGYRLIDTAAIYGNEEEVGEGIRRSGVPRGEIFVTTKLWNDDQGYETTLAAIGRSLQKLRMGYVDLYLIHWPSPDFRLDHPERENKRRETWKAMEEIRDSGKARSIGVSNYTIDHVKEMDGYARIPPAANQIEFHPFWYRRELMEECHRRGIAVEAYSPLSRAKKLGDPRIAAIARKVGRTDAQVLLRWNLQHGNIVIPKSVHRERIEENIGIFDFALSAADMRALDALGDGKSVLFSA